MAEPFDITVLAAGVAPNACIPALQKAGCRVHLARSGPELLGMTEQISAQVVVLDVDLEDLDGVEVCRELREKDDDNTMSVLFVTTRDEDYTRIAAYRSGADGYFTAPVNPQVLLACIEGMAKRKLNGSLTKRFIETSQIRIDTSRMQVLKGGKPIHLPRKEYAILSVLASRPGRVFRRDEILSEVWGSTDKVNRALDVHIREIRKKLGNNIIQTVKGVGYRLAD